MRAVQVIGPVLDQFDVVIAEGPEEGLGDLQGPGVTELLEAAVAASTTSARAARTARSIGSLTTEASRQGAGAAAMVASSASQGIPMDRANLEALRTLMARRRPILIWVSSKAASRPRRAELAQ